MFLGQKHGALAFKSTNDDASKATRLNEKTRVFIIKWPKEDPNVSCNGII
jgi:hypothetical protein